MIGSESPSVSSSPSSTPSDQPTAGLVIERYVFDPCILDENVPLPNIVVDLIDPSQEIYASALTNSEGFVRFEGLPHDRGFVVSPNYPDCPTQTPSSQLSSSPSESRSPSSNPSSTPSSIMSELPSSSLSTSPSITKSQQPSTSSAPSNEGSNSPSESRSPTIASSEEPSSTLSLTPSSAPSDQSSDAPSSSGNPTLASSVEPSSTVSSNPSTSKMPSSLPSSVTDAPSTIPSTLPSISLNPSSMDSNAPSVSLNVSSWGLRRRSATLFLFHSYLILFSHVFASPLQPTAAWERKYSVAPSDQLSNAPSESRRPSAAPSDTISQSPSSIPSTRPSQSVNPTEMNSSAPSQSGNPSAAPSITESGQPSTSPSDTNSQSPSSTPSFNPTVADSSIPSQSGQPSTAPSITESEQPSSAPSSVMSETPSSTPSSVPTITESGQPSAAPSSVSDAPSSSPSDSPSVSVSPSFMPSGSPSLSGQPSSNPSSSPTHNFGRIFEPCDPTFTIGLAGHEVQLICEGNLFATTVTDAEGYYSFTGATPGRCGVEENVPPCTSTRSLVDTVVGFSEPAFLAALSSSEKESFKFYKSGNICDTKTLGSWDAITSADWTGVNLFDTLDECCANMFWHDMDGCFSRSRIAFQFEFCVIITGFEGEGASNCPLPEIKVVETAMQKGLGSSSELMVISVGDMLLTHTDDGVMKCIGPTEQRDLKYQQLRGMTDSPLNVCGVVTTKEAECRDDICLMETFKRVVNPFQNYFDDGKFSSVLQTLADNASPPLSHLRDVEAITSTYTTNKLLLPSTLNSARGLEDDVTSFDSDASNLTRFYPTWVGGQLCNSKTSFDTWEESYGTLRDCCLSHFSWDYTACCESSDMGGC